jgi:hypothetical protein
MNIKDKEKPLLIINIFYMNKVSATCNQSIWYKAYIHKHYASKIEC